MKRRTFIKAVFGVVASLYAPGVLLGDHVRDVSEKVESSVWLAGDWNVPCPTCSCYDVLRSVKQHHILKCNKCKIVFDETS